MTMCHIVTPPVFLTYFQAYPYLLLKTPYTVEND